MFFLLRMAFWLSVVFALLPSVNPAQEPRSAAPAPKFDTLEAVSAASATVSDMTQFCTRQPEACALGGQAAVAFGQRAQEGAKMVYEFFNNKVQRPASSSSSTEKTGKAGQNTLKPSDLAPSWRGKPGSQNKDSV